MTALLPLEEDVPQEELEMSQADAGANLLALRVPTVSRLAWLVPLVLAIASASLFFVNHRHEAGSEPGDTAKAVVADQVKSFLTYSYQNIDADLAAEKGWLTGPFADQYTDLVTTKISPAAKRAKVSTSAAIASAGVVSVHRDQVQLLLFVNVTTSSSELSEPRVSGSRLLVTADLVDGAWRISALDPV
jgi:Mce-associated membrane protein